jgi:hypothetical protein
LADEDAVALIVLVVTSVKIEPTTNKSTGNLVSIQFMIIDRTTIDLKAFIF